MKLTAGEDLKPVYDLIFRVKRNHPQYVQNLRRIIHNVDCYISQYNENLIKYNRTGKEKYRDAAQNSLDDMTKLLTVLERAELLSYLSGESTLQKRIHDF